MSNDNDAPFSISVEGESTGEKWVGDFRAKKRLSHRDQLNKDAMRRELLGSQPGVPTERAMSTAMIISELTVRLTKAPKWWEAKGNGIDLEDDSVIGAVFDKAMAVEKEDQEARKAKAAAAQAELKAEADKAAATP